MNLVSACLFGEAERYHRYLPAMVRAHHNLYRGWTLRIYHDNRSLLGPYGPALVRLQDVGLIDLLETVLWQEPLIEQAMLWRLMPLWDPAVERFVMRDLDAVATWRERLAVQAWVRSGLAAHAISDLPGSHDFPTMAGMMGFSREARDLLGARHFHDLVERAGWPDEVWSSNHRSSGGTGAPEYRVSPDATNNQVFLRDYVWPLVQGRACEHRLRGCKTFGAALSLTDVSPLDGSGLGIAEAVQTGSDSLTPHIGSAEFDIQATVDFYRRHGDPEVERAITECEP